MATCATPILNATRAGEHTVFLKKTPRLLFISALTQYGDYSRAATIRSATFIQGNTVSVVEASVVSKQEP